MSRFPHKKKRAAVGGSLENFILDRNFQSRSKSRIFLIFGPSGMRQKCVRNASKMRQNGSCFIGKGERSKMRQKCVKKCAEHLWGRTPFGRDRSLHRMNACLEFARKFARNSEFARNLLAIRSENGLDQPCAELSTPQSEICVKFSDSHTVFGVKVW